MLLIGFDLFLETRICYFVFYKLHFGNEEDNGFLLVPANTAAFLLSEVQKQNKSTVSQLSNGHIFETIVIEYNL